MNRWWIVALCLFFYLVGDVVGRLGGVDTSPVALVLAAVAGVVAYVAAGHIAPAKD